MLNMEREILPDNNILIIIAVVVFIFIIIKIFSKEKLPYKLNESLLTKRELKFFIVLKNVLDETDFVIAIKPRIADFVSVDKKKLKKKSYMTYFNKIKSKHVDFLICEPTYMKPILAIELDDKSHERKDRIQRDSFVDEVYETAGLEILHIYEYDYAYLKRIIKLH